MKKIAIIVVIVICIISIFAFSACEDSQKYEKIELTKDNVFEYLSFSVEITNCIAIPLSDGNYDLSCTAVITTSPAVNCKFVGKEDTSAYIQYSAPPLALRSVWKVLSSTYFELQAQSNIDYYGNSIFSIPLHKTSSRLDFPLSFEISSSDLLNVNGYVLIPKESI